MDGYKNKKNMLEQGIEVKKEEKAMYPPLPEDIYQVQLLDITSKEVETYDSKFGDGDKEMETVLSFQYTLLEGKEGEEDLRGRNVWHNFVPIYLYIGKNGKNNLYKILEAFLGREITEDDVSDGINSEFLNGMIGKQARIGTKHKPSKDGTKIYDNVETYYTVKEQMTALTDEEVDKASVKVKDESVSKGIKYPEADINPDDAPF